MTLPKLLGKTLKDDEVLQLLEDYQAGPVTYEFDRLHEGTPDSYWLEARDEGFAIRFDEQQALKTIHCYVVPVDGFSAIDVGLLGVPLYATRDEVQRASTNMGLRVATGDANVPALRLQTEWARVEAVDFWTHYEFRDGVLCMVNLSFPRP